MNQTYPPEAARVHSAVAAVVACLLCLLAPAAAQQPDNSNAGRERTKRVTPLRTSDTSQGSRVTITSDGELNDYSAYRSGDRFIVVIPQAEGGGGGAKGRGFEGAQVSRRGKDLVYTFKLEPGASARVNQRFNRLDVQFTTPQTPAQTNANARTAPTPAATPRATRTPPEIAGLTTPTPAAQPSPGARVVSEAAQQTAAAQQPAATPVQSEASSGFPVFTETPAATPTAEPSVAPTAATEQIAQAQQPAAPAAPGSTVVQPPTDSVTGATLGATLVNNWPWILAVLLALGGVGLLLAGRSSARREQVELPPPDATPPPALRETKAVPVARATSAATTAASTTVATPPPAPSAAPPAKAATAAPVAEPRGKKKKKKGKASAGSQAAAAKAEQPKPFETEKAAGDVKPVEAAGPAAPAPFEAKAGEVDAAKLVAPAAAVAASSEIEVAPVAVDSERVGAEVKNLLAGEAYDESVVGASDAAARQLVAAELAAALTGRNAERQERARSAFTRHGYFDEAARDLQSAEAPGRRAAAAHALSLVGDRAATPHLVAALEDPSADVRRSAVEALAELRDPAAVGPLEALRWREQSRQVPRQLIMQAVELCTAAAEAEEAEETETTLVREEDARAASLVQTDAEPAAHAEAAAPELAAAEPKSKEIELAAAPAAIIDADAASESAASEAETFETSESEGFTASELAEDEVAGLVTAEEPSAVPSPESAAATAEASAVEEALAETPAETFEESAAVEAVAAESPAVDAGESGVAAGVAESAASVDYDAAELPVSVAGEETPVAGAEPSAASEAVYTFDEAEAAAWAERRTAPARGQEEDLLAELDALKPDGAESRAAGQADARPAYVAPEFALRGEESAAEDWSEPEVDVEQEELVGATPAGVFERIEPVEEPISVAPAEPVAVAVAEPSEPHAQADAVKSLELFEGAPAAAQPPADPPAVADTSTAIEPFRAEEAAVETPVEPWPAEEVGLAPALGEAPAARGLAAATDDSATGLDVPRPEKGLSASLEDASGISIIPKAIQLRLESDDSHERAQSVLALARLNTDEAFTQICAAFDDRAEEVRDAAARALYEVSEDRAESFTRALREASPDRRRNIGAALASSGLADDAVSQLTGESRDRTYDAFSLLFLMAKAGETAPLIRAIESHPDNEVRLAVVKLLALSGQQEVLPSFRRLAVRGSLPTDVRAAVMEAIYQISSSGAAKTPAAPNR
ncbi:MAG TPA: HEAT repeat domain-containing protein [Pyrinomonadaceae bacterium]|nr:HEAT repeat domain-containing protein [Pyrinomonadaceae bacterium]